MLLSIGVTTGIN